ncbi:MAG: hypothetical protein WC069_05220 [Candidatus Shapirobacteria bacterium]
MGKDDKKSNAPILNIDSAKDVINREPNDILSNLSLKIIAFEVANDHRDKDNPIQQGRDAYTKYKKFQESIGIKSKKAKPQDELTGQFFLDGQFNTVGADRILATEDELKLLETDSLEVIGKIAASKMETEDMVARHDAFGMGVIMEALKPENGDLEMALLVIGARPDIANMATVLNVFEEYFDKNLDDVNFIEKTLVAMSRCENRNNRNLLNALKGEKLGQVRDVINSVIENKKIKEEHNGKRDIKTLVHLTGNRVIDNTFSSSNDRESARGEWIKVNVDSPLQPTSTGEAVVRFMETKYYKELPDELKKLVQTELLAITIMEISNIRTITGTGSTDKLAKQVSLLPTNRLLTTELEALKNTHKIIGEELIKRIKEETLAKIGREVRERGEITLKLSAVATKIEEATAAMEETVADIGKKKVDGELNDAYKSREVTNFLEKLGNTFSYSKDDFANIQTEVADFIKEQIEKYNKGKDLPVPKGRFIFWPPSYDKGRFSKAQVQQEYNENLKWLNINRDQIFVNPKVEIVKEWVSRRLKHSYMKGRSKV